MASWSAEPQPAPPLNIPPSSQTVKVSVIDSTTRIDSIPAKILIGPRVGVYDTIRGPAYSFLIENESKGRKVLFDLGVRKDWENLAKPVVDRIKEGSWTVNVTKNVADILSENSVGLSSINAIIWSHWHWDHQGDPSAFPSSTELIVGPSFKERFMPGYPTNPESPVLESAFAGRQVNELSHSSANGLNIGGFNALDYFGDGSLYILFSPGHTFDHLCALARTTTSPDTFIFMTADAVHHAGEHRPTSYLPLPAEIRPSPMEVLPQAMASMCPGEMFYKLHPTPSATEPFLKPINAEDLDVCRSTVKKVGEFDGHENVFCIMAHDHSLMDVLEFYPKGANDWKAKGWREKGMWRFLRSFVDRDS